MEGRARHQLRDAIGRKVRELRRSRRWTQETLSNRLGLSQSRLSQIERGAGSFTAEQFLTILRLFNVPVSDFAFPSRALSPHTELQNALARLGATHLHESEAVLPREGLDDVSAVILEALMTSAPRLLTALGPVMVRNIDSINLESLGARLASSGLERRLSWLVENVRDAVSKELRREAARDWVRRYKRAVLIFDKYLRFSAAHPSSRPLCAEDVLDREVRSERTLESVRDSSSSISKRWGIISSIQPEDFSHALRAGRGSD